MKTSLLFIGLVAATTAPTGTATNTHLRKTNAASLISNNPVKGSVDDAVSATGCPCQEGQTDCNCGHIPTMVEHGHFANNAYMTKLSEMHDGEKHYKPTILPHGYFGKDEEEKKMPKEIPEEKPNMVPPGHFAKVAAALRDSQLAKTFGTVETQKEGACKILDHVTNLGRFVYEAETTVENGISESGKAINGLLDVLCPLIGERYPDAAKCMPSCDQMKERVNKLSDPKFIGEIKTKKQKCEKTKGRVVNFALLAGLSSTDMLVGTNFCPPLQLDNELSCEKVNDDQKAAKDATDESTEKDVAVKEAEKSVLKDEGLKWHRHMIKPLDGDIQDKSRLPVAPDMNATKIECDRDCKIKKQLEKEAMEESLAAGGEGTYDVHQVIKTGEEVTDEEKNGGINAPRE
jgi:hypothetical protein